MTKSRILTETRRHDKEQKTDLDETRFTLTSDKSNQYPMRRTKPAAYSDETQKQSIPDDIGSSHLLG